MIRLIREHHSRTFQDIRWPEKRRTAMWPFQFRHSVYGAGMIPRTAAELAEDLGWRVTPHDRSRRPNEPVGRRVLRSCPGHPTAVTWLFADWGPDWGRFVHVSNVSLQFRDVRCFEFNGGAHTCRLSAVL